MSEEGVKKLFIDFNKLDENSQRNKQGTGLGLSICKKMVEQMGGSVAVKSQQGVGSEFIINVQTKCKLKNIEVQDGVQEASPFSFIRKGCLDKEQKCLVKQMVREDFQPEHVNGQQLMPKVKEKKMKFLKNKMSSLAEKASKYEVSKLIRDRRVQQLPLMQAPRHNSIPEEQKDQIIIQSESNQKSSNEEKKQQLLMSLAPRVEQNPFIPIENN